MTRASLRLALALPAVVLLLLIPASQARGSSAGAARPNIILILADDLDGRSMPELGGIQETLADAGTSFSRFFVNDSLCCPSRTTILRGQYLHNHGVISNLRPDGGFSRFREEGLEESTIATWLQDAGYRTALLGKYLNGYPDASEPGYVPKGWSRWFVPSGGVPYSQYDYDLNENGRIVAYGHAARDYMTDVLARKADAFVRETASRHEPFFLYIAPYNPHRPYTPAPRYERALAGAALPVPASFNEADVADKPEWIRREAPLHAKRIAELQEIRKKRLESMLAVEDMVRDLEAALEETGQLDNTYIFFTSDNGYHLGEHRLPAGKQSPYEEDIRVPLIVRGPGVPAGAVLDHLAGNVDLAPTFADLAGAPVPAFVDGRSLAPLLRPGAPDPPAWRGAYLIEHLRNDTGTEPPAGNTPVHGTTPGTFEPPDAAPSHAHEKSGPVPTFTAIRTLDSIYVEYHDGERELYDLSADPDEMDNAAASADPVKIGQLSAWLHALEACSGSACRAADVAAP